MFLKRQGMLTGAEIERQIKKGNIVIDPYDPKCINPNSINLKLHPKFLIYDRGYTKERINQILPPKKNDKIIDETTLTDSDGNSITFFHEIDKYNGVTTKIDGLFNQPIISSLDMEPLDMHKCNDVIEFEIPEEGYVLQPGVLYIGRTVEHTFTDKYIPMINGRSSGGRLGISIHICAGFGDIGFDGTWTLEITAVEPVRIYPYEEIAQICYFTPVGKVGKYLYNGRYQNQIDATASRFYKQKGE